MAASVPSPSLDETLCGLIGRAQPCDRRDLTQAAVTELARTGRRADVAALLARVTMVPQGVTEALLAGGRSDPILVICRSQGWSWPTARALLDLRPEPWPSAGLDAAFANFDGLSQAAAQRVMRFWQRR